MTYDETSTGGVTPASTPVTTAPPSLPHKNHENGLFLVGDALEVLKQLPEDSIDCFLTSPPYWNQRDYGIEGQLGAEETPEEYIFNIIRVMREVHRILKPGGSGFLNVGDSYIQKGKRRKQLALIPQMIARGCQTTGWLLRNQIVWLKYMRAPNPVSDRFGCQWEPIFYFAKPAKGRKYYSNFDAIRTPYETKPKKDGFGKISGKWEDKVEKSDASMLGSTIMKGTSAPKDDMKYHPDGRIPGDWFIQSPEPFSKAHFAVMPKGVCRRFLPVCLKENAICIDPFGGAGTTAAVTIELGGRFVWIDLDQANIELAEDRISGRLSRTDDPSQTAFPF